MTRLTSVTTLSIFVLVGLSGCKTIPEPVVVEPPVEVIVPEVIDTCTKISALTRVVIPAETKVFYAITEIANPPYEPIQRTEKVVREIKPEEIIYVDSEGKQVLDLCDAPKAGPTPEDMDGFDDLGGAVKPVQIGGPTTLQDTPMVDLNPDN